MELPLPLTEVHLHHAGEIIKCGRYFCFSLYWNIIFLLCNFYLYNPYFNGFFLAQICGLVFHVPTSTSSDVLVITWNLICGSPRDAISQHLSKFPYMLSC